MSELSAEKTANLIDPFGRQIRYLRLSLTDRCDFRCHYCMTENTQFLPKQALLSFEELERLSLAFIRQGISKIRLTGGEPLVRRGALDFIARLGGHLGQNGFQELTLTSNGSQLSRYASLLAQAGIKRLNISLDSLKPERFRRITQRGDLAQILTGLEAAKKAGLQIKINCVALKGINDDEFDDLIAWAGREGFDLTFIEVMPMGDGAASDPDRRAQFLPLSLLQKDIEVRWGLRPLFKTPNEEQRGGPARYFRSEKSGGKVGFISPLTQNFCDNCNRIRLTCTGKLYLCLGQDNHIDFREALRAGASDETLEALILKAMRRKPKGHDFQEKSGGGLTGGQPRPMSQTGG